MQVTLQLGFDCAGIFALRDAQHAVNDHFPELGLARDNDFQFRGHGQKKEVCETDAVHRRGEGGGDAMAELGRVGE